MIVSPVRVTVTAERLSANRPLRDCSTSPCTFAAIFARKRAIRVPKRLATVAKNRPSSNRRSCSGVAVKTMSKTLSHSILNCSDVRPVSTARPLLGYFRNRGRQNPRARDRRSLELFTRQRSGARSPRVEMRRGTRKWGTEPVPPTALGVTRILFAPCPIPPYALRLRSHAIPIFAHGERWKIATGRV